MWNHTFADNILLILKLLSLRELKCNWYIVKLKICFFFFLANGKGKYKLVYQVYFIFLEDLIW